MEKMLRTEMYNLDWSNKMLDQGALINSRGTAHTLPNSCSLSQ
jgi:hypothetical protein